MNTFVMEIRVVQILCTWVHRLNIQYKSFNGIHSTGWCPNNFNCLKTIELGKKYHVSSLEKFARNPKHSNVGKCKAYLHMITLK